MTLDLIKREVFHKTRLSCNCPNCTKEILLDQDVFDQTSIVISCFKCKTIYTILKVTKTENKTILEIVKLEKK